MESTPTIVSSLDGRSFRVRTSSETGLRAGDYVNMVRFDLEAVKAFIFEEHQKEQLNMAKTAIAAADFSTAAREGISFCSFGTKVNSSRSLEDCFFECLAWGKANSLLR